MSIRSAALLSLGAFTSVALAVNHDVRIQGLAYIPSTVNAAVGDTVTFHFANNAHDVVEGSYAAPCTPATGAFYSGLDVADKKFVVTVENTDPQYFYCSVPGHCQAGMVGGINAPGSGNTVSAFSDSARTAGRSSAPDAVGGGQLLDEDDDDDSSSSTTAAPSTTSAPGSSMTSAMSSMSSAASSASAGVSSSLRSVASAATSSPTQSTTNAGTALASEYGNGKMMLHALAVAVAGGVFGAALI